MPSERVALIADYNADQGLKLFDHILKRIGFTDVVATEEYRVALETLSSEKPIHLLVVGNKIQDFGDGAKIVKMAKETQSEIYIIFQSAYEDARYEALSLGADIAVDRTWTVEEFREIVKVAVSKTPGL